MHSLKLKKPVAFFDIESTGTNVVKDRIVEISVLRALVNGETNIKTWRINPTIPIPPESSVFHGIYDEDIKDKPTFKEVAHDIFRFFEGADLGGFNVLRLDIPLLVEEFLRVELDFNLDSRKIIDAQKIFHLMEPRSLPAAYKFYCQKELENAHSAEADTVATFEVLCAQVERYNGVAIKDENGKEYTPVHNDMQKLHEITAHKLVDLAGRMVINDKGQEIFNFGKHKDRLVTEVLDKEPAFYDWVMKGDFPLDTKRKLTEIKLRNSFRRR
ncbi:3'-5' exonuclease [Xanthocytophaga flava]|uniref:3'-5' exonuclease n=1 Tax=Xanthocytophaga flava TaxID=3048013 RepID=UPI0028D7ED42|nr:3'-5' exonuclease [Xanthocytophaga flavus]MDJ1469734.1 3'-5' exonuclease [Xanthocytophaga flavus]